MSLKHIEKHYQRIGDWAGNQPESAWREGQPPNHSRSALYAVKTETGRILVGRGSAFRPESCRQIARYDKYGAVEKYIEIGD